MNLTVYDWSIVGVFFVALIVIALFTQFCTRSVADFLSANRCGGRYILGGAELAALISPAMFIANFEQYYLAGFVIIWWTQMLAIIVLIKALFGWVQYRFRETRAMTMAQFFEMRYSKNFRIFTGILAWATGILNFTIHPAITSRLIVSFCGLPITVHVFGVEVKTIFLVMFCILSIPAILAIAGGQITLMVTDFFQSQILLIASIVVVFVLLYQFHWTEIIQTLQTAPPGQSMINPMKQTNLQDFNFWYFAMLAFFYFYQEMSFQGNQGFYSAAKTPHEAKMSRILATWRFLPLILLFIVPSIVAYVVFNNPKYAVAANEIQTVMDRVDTSQTHQMRVPLTLVHFLPIGVTGLLVATFLACSISTGASYLHSWGTIFIQDVVMPIRQKRLDTKQHLRWLKASIIFVAVLAFIGGALIPVRDYVLMFFQLTFSIYAGGAGAAIIGGLYWKRGTTAGAWGAVAIGAFLCTAGFVIQTMWSNVSFLSHIAPKCPINGTQMSFFSCLASVTFYVVAALLSRKEPFDLDRILHRGKYSIKGERVEVTKNISLFRKLTGIDKEFTRSDKVASILAIIWIAFWTVAVWGGSIYGLFNPISDDIWAKWWFTILCVFVFITPLVFLLYCIGGIFNLFELFRLQKVAVCNDADDGTVIDVRKEVDTEKCYSKVNTMSE